MSDRMKRAFIGNIQSQLFGNPAARRQAVLIEKRDLFRAFHKRFAAEAHDLHCQIEDDLDKRPITEAHADAYDELVAWLNRQLQEIDKQIAAD